ncbi:unnamed protein product [Rotaria socialis]|uniref:THAP9-like helix-turn-helix domain-containing protein n=1 Tax=Rotaria socialis TaxID=392032 RepID=A0A817PW62_9BILA|nr:unnamed protein product [Rotaria socialis]CAF3328305.1 unnamed protein product [Rotaria socialis]
MDNSYNTIRVPENLLTLKGDEFFQFIKQLGGEILFEILYIQLIDSTEALMKTNNILDMFQYDSPDINRLRNKICFSTVNGDYVLRSGVKAILLLLTNILNEKRKQLENSIIYQHQEQEQIYSKIINQNPLLESLINLYRQNDTLHDNESGFLKLFIDCIMKNLNKSSNNYRYSKSVEEFAISLYILGSKITYEFVRLNLSPALPSIQKLNKIIFNSDLKISEAQFLFDKLNEYLNGIGVTYAFGAEDRTDIIQKINYDQRTNSFIGFSTPLVNGIPVSKYYQTDSFETLESWFNSSDKASLLNIHMIQPLPLSNNSSIPSAFLLSAYAVVNTYTSIDILRRWLFIFDNCLQRNIRIIGFSTGRALFFIMWLLVHLVRLDGDAKYLRAMRLASGFFSSLPYFKLEERDAAFDLTAIVTKWPWFYLRGRQVLLFFQDPIHLATKWRNRLLSSTARLRFGVQSILMKHIIDILEDSGYSKLDHGLTLSDLNPKDRHNLKSFTKIVTNDVLSILAGNSDTYGAYIYLYMLQNIISAYIDKSANIQQRLKSSWFIVFICRLWWAWIQHKIFIPTTTSTTTKRNSKANFFITKTAYLSVELNAHNILYIVLLVKQKQLPKEALNIYLFNSQSCESMFRNARSLTGVYSTRINFTAADFLNRSNKISILNQIKCDHLLQQHENEHLLFRIHHKHKAYNRLLPLINSDDVNQLDIENIISEAYNEAVKLVEHLKVSKLLQHNDIFDFNSLSTYVFRQLKSTSKMFDYSTEIIDDHDNEFDLEDEDEEVENENSDVMDQLDDNEQLNDDLTDDQVDDYYKIMTRKTDIIGMKIFDEIETCRRDSYFKLKINDNYKYIHKQSACWLLTDKNLRLSNDRLSRVIQSSCR